MIASWEKEQKNKKNKIKWTRGRGDKGKEISAAVV